MGDSRNRIGRKLVVLSGRAKGTAFILTKPQVNAGCESDNAICLKGKRVSRHHAVLVRNNGEYTLRDVSPRIGTLLNGRPTKEAALKLGDRIRIGEVEMSYESAAEPVKDTPAATPTAPLDEIAVLRRELVTAQKESDDARTLAAQTADELTCARAEAERSANEFEQRIAALTREIERLVGDASSASEAPESVSPPSPVQPDPIQASLTEQLAVMSQQNTALMDRNSALQAKISEAEESEANEVRLEAELTAAQAAIQKLNEELATARKSTKLDAIAEELSRTLQSNPAESTGVLGRFQTALAEARNEWGRVCDLRVQVDQLTIENQALRLDMAKAQEEATLARRLLSDETNQEFDRIRRSIVAKRSEKPDTISRFWRPFNFPGRAGRSPGAEG